MTTMTPEQLIELFRRLKGSEATPLGKQAIVEFRKYENKEEFLEPVIHFLDTEDDDRVRAWGTNILCEIGGARTFNYLTNLLNPDDDDQTKRKFLYTRFFALMGLNQYTGIPGKKNEVIELCQQLYTDEQEDFLARAGAAAILAKNGDLEALNWLKKTLRPARSYWGIIRTARALSEIPLPELTTNLLEILKNQKSHIDHLWQVVRALGSYRGDEVLQELGKIARDSKYSFMREAAIVSLGKIGDPSSRDLIMQALLEENAEIRYQAAIAMGKILPSERACSVIVQAALEEDQTPAARSKYLDALRLIDPNRSIATEIFSRELASEDRQKAEIAEKLMVDLGGWAAIQRLSQRRMTLNRLDSLLSESEKAIRDTFDGTIRQARLNFYFAMSVNVIIVLTGIILVGLAVSQLIQKPENLVSWILPGATGTLGVLFNLVFNNPRNNAKSDLTTLINVTVIFLGYLRQLNEIDATFKHQYLENPDFNITQMQETVTQIEKAVQQTLQSARKLKTE